MDKAETVCGNTSPEWDMAFLTNRIRELSEFQRRALLDANEYAHALQQENQTLREDLKRAVASWVILRRADDLARYKVKFEIDFADMTVDNLEFFIRQAFKLAAGEMIWPGRSTNPDK